MPEENAFQELMDALEAERVDEAFDLLLGLHPADQAEAVSELSPEQRAPLLARMSREQLADLIDYLKEGPRRSIIGELDPAALGAVLDEAEQDVAVDALHSLDPEQARNVLRTMRTAPEVAPLLPYPDDTAGGRMTRDFVALHKEWTVDQALDYLRRTRPEADQAYYLYVVDDAHKLEGVVSLRQLVVASPEERIRDLMTPEVQSVHATDDQEEVAREIQHYNLVALPVVDDLGRLLGVVIVDDLMDVAQEEATEDMYRMAGVGVREHAFSPVRESVTRRVPWLAFNMAWAFVAASVVSAFEGTIEKVAALAIFMPIIAGQGGNAGIQTATIVVRSMALGELELGDIMRVLVKEWATGLVKGVIFGFILGFVAWLWKGNVTLGIIAGVAMFLNMLVAATAGVLIPMTLRRLGLDPATVAGVFDTMLTDLMGFLIFLGLATLLVSHLT